MAGRGTASLAAAGTVFTNRNRGLMWDYRDFGLSKVVYRIQLYTGYRDLG